MNVKNMPENKTKATALSTDDYIAAIADESRRLDCEQLIRLMVNITGQPPVMWGSAIVGFGVHKYALAGGKYGEICSVGFSSRKNDISIYGVLGDSVDRDLLSRLGKHKTGKSCLYVGCLADIDVVVLEKMVADAFKSNPA
jgi:hypothetical protein